MDAAGAGLDFELMKVNLSTSALKKSLFLSPVARTSLVDQPLFFLRTSFSEIPREIFPVPVVSCLSWL